MIERQPHHMLYTPTELTQALMIPYSKSPLPGPGMTAYFLLRDGQQEHTLLQGEIQDR
jgi:hypothetical protein